MDYVYVLYMSLLLTDLTGNFQAASTFKVHLLKYIFTFYIFSKNKSNEPTGLNTA